MGATVRVRIDKRALDRELHDRDGAVGRVVAGFAGQVTKEIKAEFQNRAGGSFWPVQSTIDQGARGVYLVVTVKASKPHRIVAKGAPALVFFWEKKGSMFIGPSVNHPGSTPPEKLILSGIDNASRHIAFTAAGPSVSNT